MKAPKIIPNIRIEFGRWSCHLRIGQYANNERIAFELIDQADNYSVVAKVTVNQSLESKPDRYWIDVKNYSENAGIIASLFESGIIKEKALSVGVAMRCEVIQPEIRKVMDEYYNDLF